MSRQQGKKSWDDDYMKWICGECKTKESMMEYSTPPSHYSNLPASQRGTQCLVDQFNEDETRWRQLHERITALLKRFRLPATNRENNN